MSRKEISDKVSRKIYRKNPEFKGVKPKITERSAGEGVKGGAGGYIFIYKMKAAGPGGQTINRVLRVVVNEDGSIHKISTSR
jgi:hypothetical protein